MSAIARLVSSMNKALPRILESVGDVDFITRVMAIQWRQENLGLCLGQYQPARGLMQCAQVFAELFQVGFAGLQLGQAWGLQEGADFLIEVIAQLP